MSARVLDARSRGDGLASLGLAHVPTALEGLAGIEADVVAEVSQSPPVGRRARAVAHPRGARPRDRGRDVEQVARGARGRGARRRSPVRAATGFRAESTVMSGTPVLAALTDGLGGATPIRLRGVLNATVNVICTRMEQGLGYAEALAEAQAAGLAERDPSADVDGLDSVAKVMVLSALRVRRAARARRRGVPGPRRARRVRRAGGVRERPADPRGGDARSGRAACAASR